MGPNLRHLYEIGAYGKIEKLFERHGEALIAALEKLTQFAGEVTYDWSIDDDAELAADVAMIAQCTALLAKLELEAQP